MKILCKKCGRYLIPMYDSDGEALTECRLKDGEVYTVEIKTPRNIKHHRKLFALYNLCFENQDIFDNLEDMRYYLICKAGYYKIVDTGKGEMIVPKSLKFDKMDQTEFNQLYDTTLKFVSKWLNITEETILTELINFA